MIFGTTLISKPWLFWNKEQSKSYQKWKLKIANKMEKKLTGEVCGNTKLDSGFEFNEEPEIEKPGKNQNWIGWNFKFGINGGVLI